MRPPGAPTRAAVASGDPLRQVEKQFSSCGLRPPAHRSPSSSTTRAAAQRYSPNAEIQGRRRCVRKWSGAGRYALAAVAALAGKAPTISQPATVPLQEFVSPSAGEAPFFNGAARAINGLFYSAALAWNPTGVDTNGSNAFKSLAIAWRLSENGRTPLSGRFSFRAAKASAADALHKDLFHLGVEGESRGHGVSQGGAARHCHDE